MFIKIKELNIHYKVFNKNDSKNNVIILHGWGKDITHYEKICLHLEEKFKVFAIDLPGFGLSSLPFAPWGTKDYAELIADFVRDVQIDSPILIGHSFGGKIVIYLSANKLCDVQKVVLIGSAGIKARKNLIKCCKIYVYKLIKNIATLPVLNEIFGKRIEMYKRKFGSQDYRNASGIMRNILVNSVNEDFRNLLPLIDVPSLLIWGDKDKETPLINGQMMHKLIPCSRFVILKNAGHSPYLDDFENFTSQIDKFFLTNVM